MRVIVSGRGTISPDAAVWKTNYPSPLVILTTRQIPAGKKAWLAARASAIYTTDADEIDFSQAIRNLARDFGVKRLVAEGGAEVNAALFQQNLVDEVNLTVCPYLFGGQDAPTIAEGAGIAHLTEAHKFELVRRRRSGNEMFLVYRRAEKVIPN